jgi:hypothetical protein
MLAAVGRPVQMLPAAVFLWFWLDVSAAAASLRQTGLA